MSSLCCPVILSVRLLVAIILLCASHAWAEEPAQKSERYPSKVSIEPRSMERAPSIISSETELTTSSPQTDDESPSVVKMDSPASTVNSSGAKEGGHKVRSPSRWVFGIAGAGLILLTTVAVGIGNCAAQRRVYSDTPVHSLTQPIIAVGGRLP